MKTQILPKYLLIILLSGFLLSCVEKPVDKSIVRSPKYKKCLLEAYPKLGIFCATNSIPGLTVAVSVDNQLVWADGFGYSNLEMKVKALPSHKFRIGQVTELFTALTAAKLYEEGKLDIDKPVVEYLPEISRKPYDFTIRQLGAHVAGIRAERTEAGRGNTINPDTLIRSFINDELIFEPGAYYGVTELGFDLIGYIIEKNGKETLTKLESKILLDTLKLTNTIADNPYRITENKSSYYDYDYISEPIVAGNIDLRGKEASAGYLSSATDLIKIGNALLYPGFLKQETINLLTTPYKLKSGKDSRYSFGFIVSEDNDGHLFYGQIGTVAGGCSAILIYPDDKMVISMVANTRNNSFELPVFEIADLFRNQLHPEEIKKAPEEKAPEVK